VAFTRGRNRGINDQQPEITDLRTLSRADLSALAVKKPPNYLQTLRDAHHRIARAIAAGLSNGEVAQTCGISLGRVSMLRQDPAFMDLVAHKRSMLDVEWAAAADPVVELLASVRTKSLAMIEAKIEDAAERDEFLPSRDLATFAELGLDRTGYGKVNKNVNVNVDFAAALEKARSRSANARPMIEAQAQPPGRMPQSPPDAASPPSDRRVASALRRF
jgi:hypothetical protein